MKEICYISRGKIPEMCVGDLLILLMRPIGWIVYRMHTTGLFELGNYGRYHLEEVFEKYEIQRYYNTIEV